ncbi:hypothetical protein [Herpetosiphon gulosus]|uniref:Cytochrome oxidase assembly protein n=1 Tax=Herpetosiphon gulosus TaxID=1973496 RepID=A0ABP9X3V6_9CHLR
MIDRLFLSPTVHLNMGMLVVTVSILTMGYVCWLAWKGKQLNRWANLAIISMQLVIMIQALLGIKLLDQGLGVVQLYIHYVGGLAPLFFCSLFYWIPIARPQIKTRFAAVVTVGSFLFVLMTFTIGQAYVSGSI